MFIFIVLFYKEKFKRNPRKQAIKFNKSEKQIFLKKE